MKKEHLDFHRSLENNNNEQGSALAPKVSKEWMKGCMSEKANVPLSGKTVWMGACSVATEHLRLDFGASFNHVIVLF